MRCKETKEIFGSDKTLACVYEIEYTVMDGWNKKEKEKIVLRSI
jgi:hypothetical protein